MDADGRGWTRMDAGGRGWTRAKEVSVGNDRLNSSFEKTSPDKIVRDDCSFVGRLSRYVCCGDTPLSVIWYRLPSVSRRMLRLSNFFGQLPSIEAAYGQMPESPLFRSATAGSSVLARCLLWGICCSRGDSSPRVRQLNIRQPRPI